MHFLISLNTKFYLHYSENKLIEKIIDFDTEKSVAGAEIYIDMTNEKEKHYCLNFAEKLKNNNLKLQIHSANLCGLSNEKINEYLDYYNKFSLIYGDNINLTIHPFEDIDLNFSIKETIKIMEYIASYKINNNLKLNFLVENLNEYKGLVRTNMFEIYKIIDGIKEKLKSQINITYDIGHYVYDNSNNYENVVKYDDKIKNIHLHDISNKKVAHYPFSYGNVDLKEFFRYLDIIKYNDGIVLEMGIDYFYGNSFDKKLHRYIDQARLINKYFEKLRKIKKNQLLNTVNI